MRTILIIIIKKEKEMKYSRQREKILNKLIEYRVHPSAEQLYWKLVEDGEKIGLATVYRNLNYLAEAGVIKRFQTFESTNGLTGRLHLITIFVAKNAERFSTCRQK